MKKTLSILLAVLMIVLTMSCLSAGFTASALASTGSCGANLQWKFQSSTGELTISGTGAMKNYYSSDSPFDQKNEIKSVVFEDGVTSVGAYSFVNCKNLESVRFNSKNMVIICKAAFFGCTSLTDVTIPKSMAEIEDYAFSNCQGLKSVQFYAGIHHIGTEAFWNTGLTFVGYIGVESQWNNMQIDSGNDKLKSAPRTYYVTVTSVAGAGGYVGDAGNQKEVSALVNRGEPMEVYAKAAPGYHFVGWYNGNDKVSDAATYMLFPTDNMTLTARFEEGEQYIEPTIEHRPYCPWCGGQHEGFFQGIIGWFHSILAMLLGARY